MGFFLSGLLLENFCPDPRTLTALEQSQRLAALRHECAMPEAYAHAHYIWFVFVGIAMASAIALIIFGHVTRRIDRKKESGAAA